MIVGVGVDVVDVARVRRMVERWGDRTLRRFLTPQERRYVSRQVHPAEHLAARIAAKEAVVKAFGDSCAGRLTWRTIEVARNTRGRPDIRLLGAARGLLAASAVGHRSLHVSLTHTHTHAAANVILVADEMPEGSSRRGSGRIAQKRRVHGSPS